MVFLHDYIFRLIFNTYYKNGMEIGQKSHFFSRNQLDGRRP